MFLRQRASFMFVCLCFFSFSVPFRIPPPDSERATKGHPSPTFPYHSLSLLSLSLLFPWSLSLSHAFPSLTFLYPCLTCDPFLSPGATVHLPRHLPLSGSTFFETAFDKVGFYVSERVELTAMRNIHQDDTSRRSDLLCWTQRTWLAFGLLTWRS